MHFPVAAGKGSATSSPNLLRISFYFIFFSFLIVAVLLCVRLCLTGVLISFSPVMSILSSASRISGQGVIIWVHPTADCLSIFHRENHPVRFRPVWWESSHGLMLLSGKETETQRCWLTGSCGAPDLGAGSGRGPWGPQYRCCGESPAFTSWTGVLQRHQATIAKPEAQFLFAFFVIHGIHCYNSKTFLSCPSLLVFGIVLGIRP